MQENRIDTIEREEKENERLKKAEKADGQVVSSERSVKQYQFFIIRLAVFLLVLWILFFKVVGLTHVPGEDMKPRLQAGDLLLFYRLDNRMQAKDVVVYEHEGTTYVGRIVAVPGDTVSVSDTSHLIINKNPVAEPDIYYTTPAYEEGIEYPVKLGDNEYFIMADMREGGMDCRVFGPVERKDIAGTVITVVRRNTI